METEINGNSLEVRQKNDSDGDDKWTGNASTND